MSSKRTEGNSRVVRKYPVDREGEVIARRLGRGEKRMKSNGSVRRWFVDGRESKFD
jgi:hypothetical protein